MLTHARSSLPLVLTLSYVSAQSWTGWTGADITITKTIRVTKSVCPCDASYKGSASPSVTTTSSTNTSGLGGSNPNSCSDNDDCTWYKFCKLPDAICAVKCENNRDCSPYQSCDSQQSICVALGGKTTTTTTSTSSRLPPAPTTSGNSCMNSVDCDQDPCDEDDDCQAGYSCKNYFCVSNQVTITKSSTTTPGGAAPTTTNAPTDDDDTPIVRPAKTYNQTCDIVAYNFCQDNPAGGAPCNCGAQPGGVGSPVCFSGVSYLQVCNKDSDCARSTDRCAWVDDAPGYRCVSQQFCNNADGSPTTTTTTTIIAPIPTVCNFPGDAYDSKYEIQFPFSSGQNASYDYDSCYRYCDYSAFAGRLSFVWYKDIKYDADYPYYCGCLNRQVGDVNPTYDPTGAYTYADVACGAPTTTPTTTAPAPPIVTY